MINKQEKSTVTRANRWAETQIVMKKWDLRALALGIYGLFAQLIEVFPLFMFRFLSLNFYRHGDTPNKSNT